MESKARESRVRRMARRNGYRVWKERGGNLYRLVHAATGMVVDPITRVLLLGWPGGATLDEVEEWLSS